MPSLDINLNADLANAIQVSSGLLANVVNQYIVTPDGAPPGVSGFVFDIISTEDLVIDSDITDHYVEQNFAVQDHWAQKPIHFTLKGFQGELIDLLGEDSNSIIATIEALLPISELLPNWNIQDLQVYGAISLVNDQASKVLHQISNIASFINELTGTASRQQEAYNFFLNLWQNRQFCTIQTPFGLLVNMAVENIHSVQPSDTRFMSEFTITFKQINVVSTATTPTPATPNPVGSGKSQVNSNSSTPPVTTNSLPASFSNNIQSGVDNNTKGRITDMTLPPVDQGQTTGVDKVPGFNPPKPVGVPTILPPTNQMFATLPLTNPLLPGFIPGAF